MRGKAERQATMMLTILTPEQVVPPDHPIRQIKPIVDRALEELSHVFAAMYAEVGRPSIPPEHLLKGCILIALYSIRSERQFCEQLRYNLLFKWFLDLNVIDPAFDPTAFTHNKERLLEHDVARQFFQQVLEEAKGCRLLSSEHFTVDGTLLEAWASMKSMRPKDGGAPTCRGKNPAVDFRGEQRANATHASTTDPEARLARKGLGHEATLAFAEHVLMDNRHGLVVDVQVTQATGTAERAAAIEMLERVPGWGQLTVGADKGYDTREFVEACRLMGVTPHVACKRKGSALDRRTTRHAGYAASQRTRKRVEEIFGWTKTVGGGRKLRYRGVARNQLWAEFTATAYNLVRIAKLILAGSGRPAMPPVPA